MTSKTLAMTVGLIALAVAAAVLFMVQRQSGVGQQIEAESLAPPRGLGPNANSPLPTRANAPSLTAGAIKASPEPTDQPKKDNPAWQKPGEGDIAWWIPMSADEFAAARRQAESIIKLAEPDAAEASSAGDGAKVTKTLRPFGLSDAEMLKYFDSDGDGVLNDLETAEADAVLTAKMSETDSDSESAADAESAWQAERLARFDANGDGELDLDESYEAYLSEVRLKASWRFHERYDADRDGAVGPADLEAFLLLYQSKDPRADVDDDGRLTDRDVEAFEIGMGEFGQTGSEQPGTKDADSDG